jgi:hypothetical protein
LGLSYGLTNQRGKKKKKAMSQLTKKTIIPELSEHSVYSTAHLQLTNSVSKTSKTKVVANYSGMNYYVVKGSREGGGDPKGPKRERDKRGEREGERPILSCPEQQQQQPRLQVSKALFH